ncbi:MAG: hypothetical protein KJ011_11330 [Burkholderiaceae bacterium]|nr:hypothetical protein [Burkholderiaceae bacterium]
MSVFDLSAKSPGFNQDNIPSMPVRAQLDRRPFDRATVCGLPPRVRSIREQTKG